MKILRKFRVNSLTSLSLSLSLSLASLRTPRHSSAHARARCPAAAPLLPCRAPSPPHSSTCRALAVADAPLRTRTPRPDVRSTTRARGHRCTRAPPAVPGPLPACPSCPTSPVPPPLPRAPIEGRARTLLARSSPLPCHGRPSAHALPKTELPRRDPSAAPLLPLSLRHPAFPLLPSPFPPNPSPHSPPCALERRRGHHCRRRP